MYNLDDDACFIKLLKSDGHKYGAKLLVECYCSRHNIVCGKKMWANGNEG